MKPTKPAVQSLKPATQAMELPESWQQKSAFGFLGFDLTPAGRLVRLADVLRWLGDHPNPLPHPMALTALCDAMPPDAMQWLYELDRNGGYAIPVPTDYMFGYQTAAQIDAANVDAASWEHEAKKGDRWLGGRTRFEAGKLTTTPATPTEPGLPALLRYIKAMWANEGFKDEPMKNRKKKSPSYLAIPLEKAAEHWGWGCGAQVVTLHTVPQSAMLPTTWAELVRYRKENPGHSWTQDMRRILCAEEKRRNEAGHSGVRKSMADELGDMTSSGLGDQIRKASSGTKSGRGRKAA